VPQHVLESMKCSQPWIQGGYCCTRVQWVMVGDISNKWKQQCVIALVHGRHHG
jgi:hypothetical protein